MSAARTERLLNLLTLLLNTRRPLSFRDIRDMDEFQAYVSHDPKSGERAFERDKAALIELGVPLRWVPPDADSEDDGVGGYIIDKEQYYLPPLDLNPSEMALLSLAGSAALAMDTFPGRQAMVRAMAKLGFDAESIETLPSMAHTPILQGEHQDRIAHHLDLLHNAVAERRSVMMAYQNARGDIQERQVDLYGLYYRQGVWYAVGWCHLRHAQRTFHLGRMQSVRLAPSAIPVTIPPDFDLKAHADRRPWEYRGGITQEVVIKLAPRLLPAVNEIFGAHVRIESQPQGHMHVHIQAQHPEALLWAVLPFGASAEILEPLSLREATRDVYQQLAQRYASDAHDAERKSA